MTKTYELPNERMIIADVDEKKHTATVSVYVLDNLVETVNKTGYWIEHQEGRWIYAKCSECETVHDTQTNFCPSCGCRMVEPQESETEQGLSYTDQDTLMSAT